MKNVIQKIGRLTIHSRFLRGLILVSSILSCHAHGGVREQAKRIHDRLAGIPPSARVLQQMVASIDAGDVDQASYLAMEDPAFYQVTLKHWITPWTNEEGDVFAPLNDYTATVIGMIRDDRDFRQILSADVLYIANNNLNLPAYSPNNNGHYQALEDQSIDLKANLIATTQSSLTGLPSNATAGVMTTRAAAKAFFKDGTNRAMFRFTLINQLCTDMEGVKDISRSPDRIRQDVSRSPGGDSRIFNHSCVGCHSGMDPLAQAFAYYQYDYHPDNDPEGENGALQYNAQGEIDPDTGSRVQGKYHINVNNFPFGYITENDNWRNYWRAGPNKNLGWDQSRPATGNGAKTMGQELANSMQFARCQVKKVFRNVCLREPQDTADRAEIETIVASFRSNGYLIKQVFADTANYCKGK